MDTYYRGFGQNNAFVNNTFGINNPNDLTPLVCIFIYFIYFFIKTLAFVIYGSIRIQQTYNIRILKQNFHLHHRRQKRYAYMDEYNDIIYYFILDSHPENHHMDIHQNHRYQIIQ